MKTTQEQEVTQNEVLNKTTEFSYRLCQLMGLTGPGQVVENGAVDESSLDMTKKFLMRICG